MKKIILFLSFLATNFFYSQENRISLPTTIGFIKDNILPPSSVSITPKNTLTVVDFLNTPHVFNVSKYDNIEIKDEFILITFKEGGQKKTIKILSKSPYAANLVAKSFKNLILVVNDDIYEKNAISNDTLFEEKDSKKKSIEEKNSSTKKGGLIDKTIEEINLLEDKKPTEEKRDIIDEINEEINSLESKKNAEENKSNDNAKPKRKSK